MTKTYSLALYEHCDMRAGVIDSQVSGERLRQYEGSCDAPVVDAHGWDFVVGDVVEVDGEPAVIVRVCTRLGIDRAGGNYITAYAEVP